MKYKKLTKEQILISIDRLTRFKQTKEKYIRVFTDILTHNLIEPKYKKSELESLDYANITQLASEIINKSIEQYHNNTNKHGNHINQLLKEYENTVFINDNQTQKLLDNNINYTEAANLITQDSSVNLKWLKAICSIDIEHGINTTKLEELRREALLKYPLKAVMLVEGITEELLIPAFARFIGFDFYANGIHVIPSGGKNQVVKMYYQLSNEVKLPIFVLLDKDAEENINQIRPKLRSNDKIHLVSCGEFEDLLPKSLIAKTVNSHFKNFISINEADLSVKSDKNTQIPTAKILEEIFKTRGLHEFKKAEFAKLVRAEICENSDISDEIREIINELKNML